MVDTCCPVTPAGGKAILKSMIRPRSCRRPEIPDPVEGHGNDNERAEKGALPESANSQYPETVADHLDQRRTDQRAEGGANSTGEIGAADHRSGDDLQFHARPKMGGDGAEPTGFDHTRNAG